MLLYSLDILNRTNEVVLIDMEMNEHKIYISVYTDEFQKVFEVSD